MSDARAATDADVDFYLSHSWETADGADAVSAMAARIAADAARIRELEAALSQAADDLEAEAKDYIDGTDTHAALMRQATAARAVLAAAPRP